MDQILKEQWTAALRSGEYDQGQHVLRTTNEKYCCLGVLCDVLGATWSEANTYGGFYTATDGITQSVTSVPSSLLDKFATDLEATETFDTLMKLNDEGASFHTISDYIDEVM